MTKLGNVNVEIPLRTKTEKQEPRSLDIGAVGDFNIVNC